MLTLQVGATDIFNEETGVFGSQGGVELQLEHSLVALSKWEAMFEKPFLGKDEKSAEEVLEYIKCMVVSADFPPGVFDQLSQQNMDAINAYMNRKGTATWFTEHTKETPSYEVITSELIYYWMTAFRIPFVCESWHLNRLFALIRICNLKQQKPKPMSRGEIAQRNRELNAQRKAELKTRG